MNRDKTRTTTRRRRSRLALGGVAALAVVTGLAACSSGSSSSAPAAGSSGTASSGAGGGASASPGASSSVTVEAGANCSGSSAVKPTFWAWVPGLGRAVTAFNQSHPGICVTQEDVGAGDPEYVAITNAIKAGSGAPDVAEVEYDELPSFVVTKSVDNLVPYGGGQLQGRLRAVGLVGGQPGPGRVRDPGRRRADGVLLQQRAAGQVQDQPAGDLGAVRG